MPNDVTQNVHPIRPVAASSPGDEHLTRLAVEDAVEDWAGYGLGADNGVLEEIMATLISDHLLAFNEDTGAHPYDTRRVIEEATEVVSECMADVDCRSVDGDPGLSKVVAMELADRGLLHVTSSGPASIAS